MSAFRLTVLCAAGGALFASCAGQSAGGLADKTGSPPEPKEIVERPVEGDTLAILSYASRASSSHNAQPWRVRVDAEDTLVLLADRSRYLPAVDPTHREMFLSFGAFLETLDRAARALGYQARVTLTADTLEDLEIARVRLETTGEPRDPAALNLIASLYTPKGPLASQPLDAQSLRSLGAAEGETLRYLPPASAGFGWVREQAPRAGLHQAWRDPVQEELAEYLLFSRRSARERGYGITPEMMELAPAARFFWYAFMTPKSALSKGFRNGIEGITARQLDESAGVFVLTSPDSSPAALIEAGRAYQRLKLAAFARGIGIHPVSALLEEEPWLHQVADTLGGGRPVQFILRTGRIQRELPDFQTDALTSASIRMPPERFVAAP